MANEILTGGALGLGTAVNNNQSDNFTVAGSYNTIDTFGGNETITGVNLPPYGLDNATIVNIGSTGNVNPASNVQVNDTIALDGGNNTIEALSGVVLTQSTVTIGVSGGTGGNLVSVDNIGGINSVNTGGPNNSITLNADASNQVTAGTGYDFVDLGAPGAAIGGGFTSNVALSGNGNIVEASDQNLNVDPGANNNFVEAGNGNDSVVLTGSGNVVALGDGTDNVSIGGSNNLVEVEIFGPSISPNTDTINIGGNYNIVEEASLSDRNTINLTISGAIGFNTVVLGGGNDSVNVGGHNNTVELLGNGNDTISLLGTGGSNYVLVGGGTDTVTVNGNGNTIDVNPLGTPATDNVTATGNSNYIVIESSATLTPSALTLGGGSGDQVGLGTGSYNVTGTGSNNIITAADNSTSSDNINLGNGNANAITFGNGTDTVTDNGNGNAFVGGNGNDTVNATGNSDAITLGNGNDLLNLGGSGNGINLGTGNNTVNGGNGSNNSIVANDASNTTNFYNFGTGSTNGFSLGNGNDTVTDNGNTVTVFAGNGNDVINANGNGDGIGLGNGNNVVSATGTGDTITIAGTVNSTDTLTIGSNSAGSISGGTLDFNIGSNTINGNGDVFNLSGLALASQINVFGDNNLLDFINNASGTVNLANNVTGNTIEIQGSSNTYDGSLTIDNFQNNNINGKIDFEDLYGAKDGNHINSLSEIAANSTILNGGTLEILVQNHGSILLPLVTGLNSSNVAFS